MPEENKKPQTEATNAQEAPDLRSQLQPWSAAPVSSACIEQYKIMNRDSTPPRRLYSYQTPKPNLWRPVLGYENVGVLPLPSQPVTNALADPCFTPKGMSTAPLHFPNLVTGYERNPAHAARAALNTRYTPKEWDQNNIGQYNEADTTRNYSERLRSDFVRLMRETDEKTADNQLVSGRTIGERLTDLNFWRNEVKLELDNLVIEANLLNDAIRAMEKSTQDMEAPLHIAQECLYQREQRDGLDLVHDQVENSLLEEVELIRNDQEKMRAMIQRAKDQQRNNRAAQFQLETDVRSKEGAINIDSLCHRLNNFSNGLHYYGGIEQYDTTITSTETWAENSNQAVKKSQYERSKSAQLRSDIDNLINSCANEVWNAWGNTNNALARRAAEVLEAKTKSETRLYAIQQEIFDVEKNMELLRKAINDKSVPLKVAQTRLEARSHRRGIENSRDEAQKKLIHEVTEIQKSIDQLHRKLQEAEAQQQQLLKTRASMENSLFSKVNALYIDRDKCLGMRRAYPITATIRY